ncbi:MAG: gamma-aminobutyrate dehydratase [Acidobacteria bacterium]|nr:MAG: gamma-aminobutyrate dehydratase [Acidobacteriota bacterium]
MGLRSAEQYVASLKDGRRVFFRGKRVADVTTHPVIGVAVKHAATDYRMADDPAYRDLAVVTEGEGAPYSRYYQIPRTTDDLLRRSSLIEQATAEGGTLVVLIKEIGTDALSGLLRVSSLIDAKRKTTYHERVKAFYRHCRDNDLAVAVAQTDVKGDRSLGPSAQADPDLYVRIAERRPDGIVVRGAKAHTSVSTNANELIVLPTRAMGPGDEAYAVSFAVPLATPGLTLLASAYDSTAPQGSPIEYPISAHHKMMETTTVFEDVFVPWERVFLAGEPEFAGPVALSFVEHHRFTAISYKLPLVDALVGSAMLMADLNGIAKAGHARDKVTQLISYAETLRGLTHYAALRGTTREAGVMAPDPMYVNMAKYHFAHGYHEAVRHVQDLAGGALVTGPGAEDLTSAETAPYYEKYYVGRSGVTGRERLRALSLVRNLVASEFAAYQEVLAVHAEGSLEAEKQMVLRSYNPKPALEYVRRLLGAPGA